MTRCGISPILSTVILILLVVGMAGGVVTVLLQSEERVTEETRRPELDTVNATCMPDRVIWWINNTGRNAVETPQADVFVSEEGRLNTTLSREDVALEAGFSRPHGVGKVEVVPQKPMALGEQYGLELDLGSTTLSSSCRVGGSWWDADWPYRRAIQLDTGSEATVRIQIDAASPVSVRRMVDEGKLRSDCADVRVVNRGEPAFYDIRQCDPDTQLRIRANLSSPRPGTAYLYYGNLQAGYANVSVKGPVTHNNPGLGPEERVNLP